MARPELLGAQAVGVSNRIWATLKRWAQPAVHLELVFQLGVGDLDPGVRFEADAVGQDLVTDVATVALEVHAILGQDLLELRQRELVVFGNVRDLAVELGVIQAEALLLGLGDLQAFVDQVLDGLLAQLLLRRQLVASRAASACTMRMRSRTSEFVTTSWFTNTTM